MNLRKLEVLLVFAIVVVGGGAVLPTLDMYLDYAPDAKSLAQSLHDVLRLVQGGALLWAGQRLHRTMFDRANA